MLFRSPASACRQPGCVPRHGLPHIFLDLPAISSLRLRHFRHPRKSAITGLCIYRQSLICKQSPFLYLAGIAALPSITSPSHVTRLPMQSLRALRATKLILNTVRYYSTATQEPHRTHPKMAAESAARAFMATPRFAVVGASSDPSKFGHKSESFHSATGKT